MKTLIGLLFILLPVILKLIGKKLEKSGDQDKARKVREIAQALDGEDSPMHDWKYFGKEASGAGDEELSSDVKHEPLQQVEPVPIHTMPETAVEGKPSVSRKPILLEEDATEKKDKIDSKNLVIYYEIMKQKF